MARPEGNIVINVSNSMVLTFKDRDPILVSKQLLVDNSSVFAFIILECCQPEHDMTDFTPNVVELFLTVLKDKKVEQIKASDFKELHKISTVFDVKWLIKSCRDMLLEKIDNVGVEINYNLMFFLFDECFYIHKKWGITRLMETLILKVRFRDNYLFLSRYLRNNYDQLSNDQWKFLLHLAGCSPKVFLEFILERLNNQEHLDYRTKYLLQKINLTLCLEKYDQMYYKVSERLSDMGGLTKEDLRMVLKLTNRASKEAGDRRKVPLPFISESPFPWNPKDLSSSYRQGYVEEWIPLNMCNHLGQILDSVTEEHIRSMYSVIEILLRRFRLMYSNIEAEEFVESLESLCDVKPLQKVSKQYIDMHISALNYSNDPLEHRLIVLLKKIRDSEELSSSYDNIHLEAEDVTSSVVVQSLYNFLGFDNKFPEFKHVFKVKHPGVTDCDRNGNCGFIVQRRILHQGPSSYTYNDYKLLRGDDTNNRLSGVHLHNVIKPEDINFYNVKRGKLRDGKTLLTHSELAIGLLGVSNWGKETPCVDLNIRDWLVARF